MKILRLSSPISPKFDVVDEHFAAWLLLDYLHKLFVNFIAFVLSFRAQLLKANNFI